MATDSMINEEDAERSVIGSFVDWATVHSCVGAISDEHDDRENSDVLIDEVSITSVGPS